MARLPSPRHVLLLAGYAIRFASRGGGVVVYFLLTLTFAITVAELMILPVEKSRAFAEREGMPMTREIVLHQFGEGVREVIITVLAPRPEAESGPPQRRPGRPFASEPDPELERHLDFLIDARPSLLSAVFLIIAYGLPLLVASGAFNQFAGDIGDRGLRYLLLRTERTNIFLGRFLGTYLMTAAAFIPVLLTITAYVVLKLEVYGWGESLSYAGRAFAAYALLALPYVALCSWLSGACSSAFVGMTACTVAVVGIPMAAAMGGAYRTELGWILYAQPWWVHHWFFHPDWSRFAAGAGIALAYAVAYLAVGLYQFNRRDL